MKMKCEKRNVALILIHTAAVAAFTAVGVCIYKRGKKDAQKEMKNINLCLCGDGECDCENSEDEEKNGSDDDSDGDKPPVKVDSDTLPDISAETANMPSVEDNCLEINEVYWSNTGNVWHKNKDCVLLANAHNIENGTVTQAKDAGKKRKCGYCFKNE